MSATDGPDPASTMTITIPADVRFFRPVRLAVGGLAALAGFDVEAIDDLRIGVDELCAALTEAGTGDAVHLELHAEPGVLLRIEGHTDRGPVGLDDERFAFSRQILSVVADSFGYEIVGDDVTVWLERRPLSGRDGP